MDEVYILGSDRRFSVIERLCRERGLISHREPKETIGLFLLPLGARDEEILQIAKKAKRGSVLFAGRAEPSTKKALEDRGIGLFCLLENELYLEKNSAATAEGTLSEVIRNTDRILSEACILICGYGHCGRALARLFWLCGSEVWVFSHEGSMRRAKEDGFNLYHAPGDRMGMFDLVINTVPAPLLTEDFCARMRRGTKIFQVASGLSGAEPEALMKKGVEWYPLPSLPGRFSPETEAETIFSLMERFLT
jgi:dipicolinate synthase subunit A